MDTSFISDQLDTVLSHLNARRASPELIANVLRIPVLRKKRNELIGARDKALSSRKSLSGQIGMAMKGKAAADVDVQKLKDEVEQASKAAEVAEGQLVEVDKEIEVILSVVPNLLDDRS